MPLEISEIGVRLAVGQPDLNLATNKKTGKKEEANTNSSSNQQSEALNPSQVEEIVQQSTQKVLENLRAEEDR